MQTAIKLRLQQGIDRAVALHTALANKDRAGDDDPVMRLAFGPGAGMADMLVRFIDHFERSRSKGLRQDIDHPLLAIHGNHSLVMLCFHLGATRPLAHNSRSMNFNDRIFDRIRIKPADDPVARPEEKVCEHPGCINAGLYRAPKGREREGQYFLFCMEHVRAYNAKYNYFKDMPDDAIQDWQKDALTGHRPTWKMGQNAAPLKDGARYRRAARPEDMGFDDPLGAFRAAGFAPRGQRKSPVADDGPSIGNAARKSYEALGLEPGAAKIEVSARYKELLKRLHPDVNGGDRSTEAKLQEVIRAHKTLKAAGLA